MLSLSSMFNHFVCRVTCSHPWFPVWLLHPIPSPRLLPSLLFLVLSKSSVSSLQHSCSFIVNFGSAPSDLGCLPPLFTPALAAQTLTVSVSPPLLLVPAPWGWSGLCQSPSSCSPTQDQAGEGVWATSRSLQRPEVLSSSHPAMAVGSWGSTMQAAIASRTHPSISSLTDGLSSIAVGLGCRSTPRAAWSPDPMAGSALSLYEGRWEPQHECLWLLPQKSPSWPDSWPWHPWVHGQPQGLGASEQRA